VSYLHLLKGIDCNFVANIFLRNNLNVNIG